MTHAESLDNSNLIYNENLYPRDYFRSGHNLCIGVTPYGAVFSTPGLIQAIRFRDTKLDAELVACYFPIFRGADLRPLFTSLGQIENMAIYPLLPPDGLYNKIAIEVYQKFIASMNSNPLEKTHWGENYAHYVGSLQRARIGGGLSIDYTMRPSYISKPESEILFPSFTGQTPAQFSNVVYMCNGQDLIELDTATSGEKPPYQGTLIYVNEN